MRKVILLFLLFILATPLFAQNSLLKGRVINMSDSTTIIGAVVVVTDSTKSYEKIAVTDSEGEYVIENCPDRFVIAISHMGYEKSQTSMSLTDLGNNFLLTTLEPDVQSIGDITVTAAPPTLVRKSNKFVMDGVHRSPMAKGRSSTEFIKFIPMLNIETGGISILNKAVSEVQINGRSIGSGEIAMVILNGIPAEDIERIEIIPVAGSAYSASSSGGIINVVLKKRPDEGVRATVRLSGSQAHYDSQGAQVFLSYATGKLNLTTVFSANRSRSYYNTVETYEFLKTDLKQANDMTNKFDSFGLGSYFNLDYNINKKHTIGTRISMSGRGGNYSNNSTTVFSKISSYVIDSIYTQSTNVKLPQHAVPVRANLNHTFKTDDKGSNLQTDLFYLYSPSDDAKSNIYTKTAGGVNTIASDFMQKHISYSNFFVLKSNYTHVFKDESELKSGIYLSHRNVTNDFSHINRSGGIHVTDPKRSNVFIFTDLNFSAFVAYDREWSKKFSTTLGLRTEKHLGRGDQKTTGELITRNEFGVFPNLSLSYNISENHVLSIDMGTYTNRPHYTQLNPFVEEISPVMYRKNDPNVKSSKGIEASFNYNFLKDFNLAIEYDFTANANGDIYFPDDDGRTMISRMNVGDYHMFDFSLLYSKYLFQNRWYISTALSANYDYEYGEIKGVNLSNTSWSYYFKLNNNIVLSKKHDLSLSLDFRYSSKSQGMTTSSDASYNFDMSLMKRFKNSSLAFYAYSIQNKPYRYNRKLPDYNVTSIRYSIPTFALNYTHTFGNLKVKQLQGRSESSN